MSEKKQDELLAHNYDGIQEYDNSLPGWWVGLFWVTVIFGVIYVGYYVFGPGLSQEQTLALELKQIEATKQAAPAQERSEAMMLAMVSNASDVQAGKAVFDGKCVPCHGAQAQGIVGPNLTDDYWIHGGTLLEIRKTIVEGVPAKGMVSWRGLLTDKEIDSVVAYIRTLHGSNPPGAKAQEGQLVSYQ